MKKIRISAKKNYVYYGVVNLDINSGVHNAPVIGYLGINIIDDIDGTVKLIPISVLINRRNGAATFSYGARFQGKQTLDKFMRQRFFPNKLNSYLV